MVLQPDCMKNSLPPEKFGKTTVMEHRPSGKGGLASELPKAAWVSLETVKTSKIQRHPGSCKSKSTWNSIFKDS